MDANTALVFETIGQIKKSLQCSICLELLLDPHSTRCNHQFCSHCIRKVVDDRKNKQKEALCPLCKSPITKRSLFANPRLEQIVGVVQRLNISFKEDAKLPNSPYPLVHIKTQGQSKSYLQFVSSHPTPQKPSKRKTSPLAGVNGQIHLLKSTSARKSGQQSLLPDDVPAGQRSRDNVASKSIKIIRETPGSEILALLETNAVETEALPKNKVADADLESNQGILRENQNENSEETNSCRLSQEYGDKQKTSSASEQPTHSDESYHNSDSNTVEMAKSSQASSSQASSFTRDSVSMLECLMLSQSQPCSQDDAKQQTNAIMSIRGELDDEPNSKNLNDEKLSDEKSASCSDENRGINGGISCLPDKTSLDQEDGLDGISWDVELTNRGASSCHNGLAVGETYTGRFSPVSLNKPSNQEERVSEAPSSEIVPASMESISTTSDILRVPHLQEFVSEDEISFTLSNHNCVELNVVEKEDPEIENPSIHKRYVHVTPSQQHDPTNSRFIHSENVVDSRSAQVARGVLEPASNNCDYSEALFMSPSSSSCLLRCQTAKRKYDDDEEEVEEQHGRTCGRKCRRLDEKEWRTSPSCKSNTSDKLPKNDRNGKIPDNVCNTKIVTSRKQVVKSSMEHVDSAEDRLRTLAWVVDRPCVKEIDQNLTSQHHLLKAADNDTEDEIFPPTPPVRVDHGKPSPDKAENPQGSGPSTSQTTQPAIPPLGMNSNEEKRKAYDFDIDDSEDEEAMVVDQVENHLSSSEEDSLFEGAEPCDQDNIGLLRKLAPSTAKHDENECESDNECDEETSDCRTADTTSVSSLAEGDGMEVSSQRIQYLHQVVAETGGEIEKLTAHLRTLRNNGTRGQTMEEDDEVESEKEDDDERHSCSSLSPPPILEPSALSLTKMPSAIQDMQMLLRQNSDSEGEPATAMHGDRLSSGQRDNTKRVNTSPRKTHSSRTNANPLYKERLNHVDNLLDNPTSAINTTKENSEKENYLNRQRRSVVNDNSSGYVSDDVKKRRSTTKYNGELSEKVLAEHRSNHNPNTTTSKLCRGGEKNLGVETLDTSARPAVSFVVTRLPKQFVSLAGYLAKRNGGKLTGDLTSETTHVIMPTDSKMYASRKNYTIKYLLGVALGKRIMSQLWLTACVKSGCLVNERLYEVKGDPEAAQSHVPNLARTTRETKGAVLFDGVSVVCFGDFSGAISKFHITQLVQFCGGQIINSKKEAASKKVSDLVVIVDPVISKQTTLLVKDFCETFNTFPVSAEWVTDSIANYQLQDIEEYRLDSQEIQEVLH